MCEIRAALYLQGIINVIRLSVKLCFHFICPRRKYSPFSALRMYHFSSPVRQTTTVLAVTHRVFLYFYFPFINTTDTFKFSGWSVFDNAISERQRYFNITQLFPIHSFCGSFCSGTHSVNNSFSE